MECGPDHTYSGGQAYR